MLVACSSSANEKNRATRDKPASGAPSSDLSNVSNQKKEGKNGAHTGGCTISLRKKGCFITAFEDMRHDLRCHKPVGAERPDLDADVQTPIKQADQIEWKTEVDVTVPRQAVVLVGLAAAVGKSRYSRWSTAKA